MLAFCCNVLYNMHLNNTAVKHMQSTSNFLVRAQQAVMHYYTLLQQLHNNNILHYSYSSLTKAQLQRKIKNCTAVKKNYLQLAQQQAHYMQLINSSNAVLQQNMLLHYMYIVNVAHALQHNNYSVSYTQLFTTKQLVL